MNPKTIFSAVAAVCLMMILVLPRLAVSSRASPQELPSSAALTAAAQGVTLDPAKLPEQPVLAAAVQAQPTTAPALPRIDLPVYDIPIIAPPENPLPASVAALPPDLESFAASIAGGDPAAVAGVYAQGVFALPVRQQPVDNPAFVSDEDGTATQYALPGQSGVVALLAHNTLSGRLFFHLRDGDSLYLVYGDGRVAGYRIRALQSYQALSPYDTRSDFVDLNQPGGALLNYTALYQRVYTTAGTLVLQTCIEANGEPTWGRLFILADPI